MGAGCMGVGCIFHAGECADGVPGCCKGQASGHIGWGVIRMTAFRLQYGPIAREAITSDRPCEVGTLTSSRSDALVAVTMHVEYAHVHEYARCPYFECIY